MLLFCYNDAKRYGEIRRNNCYERAFHNTSLHTDFKATDSELI